MGSLLKLKFNLNKDVMIPFILVWVVMFIISGILFLFSPKSIISSTSVAVFYSIWVLASMLYAVKNGGLKALGLPGKRWLVAILLGIALGFFLVMGNNSAPDFKGAALIPLPVLSLLTLIITGVTAAFCEVVMLMGYYYFRLEKALGPILSILLTALTWTAYHLLLLSSPGSIPSVSAGLLNFIIGIFMGSLIITFVTFLTKSILAAFLINAISNVFINWFRMSVRPEDVLIADNSFPLSGIILIIIYIAAIIYVQTKCRKSPSGNIIA